jgi:sulfite reductase (NADPH) flavoprotein alpha-component
MLPETEILPFNEEQKQLIDNVLNSFDSQQINWLAGYLTGIGRQPKKKKKPAPVKSILQTPAFTPSSFQIAGLDVADFTILCGSRTGNGRAVAEKLKEEAQLRGLKVHLFNTNEFLLNKLKDIRQLIVIISTHGEGVPPAVAQDFYDFLHDKRAPKLSNTKFSVLALGDSNYFNFCKTGVDIDQMLEKLGARRFYSREDCDVDFWPSANKWIDGVLSKLAVKSPSTVKSAALTVLPTVKKQAYNKQNPFKAKVLHKFNLNGEGSDKETWHYELSIESSGLAYEPGDAVGIYPVNSPKLVQDFIQTLSFNPAEQLLVDGNKITLEEYLRRDAEIASLSSEVVRKYNFYAESPQLEEILKDSLKLKEFLYGRDVIDLFTEYPTRLNASDLPGILRKLQPRLYSISSSLKAHPNEVHLTIAAVRYHNTRDKEGVCSTYLSDRIDDEDYVNLFIEKNTEFRLPSDPQKPIIMVGPGTGIAPFRAFLQEREAIGAKGKNWLFFGNRHFATDFLYQDEWQTLLRKKTLTYIHAAFSRDSEKKNYVQNKMKEYAAELFRWLENGAYFYVCGDMKNMWRDVNQSLIEIVSLQGHKTKEEAEAYVQQLRRSGRYQLDVY